MNLSISGVEAARLRFLAMFLLNNRSRDTDVQAGVRLRHNIGRLIAKEENFFFPKIDSTPEELKGYIALMDTVLKKE
jgi:hypothetical protein